MSFSHNYIWGASGEVFFPQSGTQIQAFVNYTSSISAQNKPWQMRSFSHRGNWLIKEIHGSFKGSSFRSRSSLGQRASSSLLWAVSWPASAPCQRPFPGQAHPCLTTALPSLLLCGLVRLSSPPMAALSALALCSHALSSPEGKAELIYCDTWTHMQVPSRGSCCSFSKKGYAGLQGFCFSLSFSFYFGFHEVFNFVPSLRKQNKPSSSQPQQ